MMGPGSSPEDTNKKLRPWIPFTFTYPFLLILFILPTLAIGTLEVLYRVAKKNQGLTNADDNIFPTLSLYVSAGVTFTIAATFSSFNFTVASFSPYYALSLSRTTADHSVLVNFFGSIPPISLYRTLKERHYSVSLSSIAGVISSVLTIVVSGLWITNQSTNITTHFETKQTTTWDLNWINSATDDGGASSLLNILRQNLSIAPPAGVWDDLVFPEWNSSDLLSIPSHGTTDSVKLSLPALRPELKCDFVLQTAVSRDGGLGPGISKQVDIPENCAWRDGDSTRMMFNLSYYEVEGSSFPIWISSVFDVPTIPWNGTNDDLFFDYSLSKVSSSEPSIGRALTKSINGCPSFWIFNSLIERNFNFNFTDLYIGNSTTLMCNQKIQQVQTSVVLKSEAHGGVEVPNLLSAPVLGEQTAIYLTNGLDNSSSFRYRIEPHLARNLSQPLQDRYHPFFSLITPGNFTEEFLNFKSLDDYKAAIDKAYKSYMVHVINSSIFRKNVTGSSHEELPVIKGTIHKRVARLTIDYTSKLVLQILLSIMLLLEAGAVWQMDLRGTLPRKPYSIASIMGFLAGSSICEPTFMPKGAEWMSKDELSRLFGYRTLGLGWWDDDYQDTGNDETEHPRNLRYGIDFGEPHERSFRAGCISKYTK
ncbi:hypothetical protein E0Z10_g5212 [Xylaria hypoxylon]|uniref:Uncharacterized protein n=1 Tax=Xylaria hypoxylon TaxID=37992 RepID=A0A4Z0YWJ7_9PEZI|nr:hypothetical protein E0Z10_g5212 [Xylaria hypoxylon]